MVADRAVPTSIEPWLAGTSQFDYSSIKLKWLVCVCKVDFFLVFDFSIFFRSDILCGGACNRFYLQPVITSLNINAFLLKIVLRYQWYLIMFNWKILLDIIVWNSVFQINRLKVIAELHCIEIYNFSFDIEPKGTKLAIIQHHGSRQRPIIYVKWRTVI